MRQHLLFLALVLSACIAHAQLNLPDIGNNPSSIDWKYYDSPASQVIFPKGNEQQALRVANILNYIYDPADSLTVTIGPKRRRFPLLIQTNQVISNGYVALAPYRSEYYATSFQNFNELGSLNWLDILAIHESRHTLQIRNGRRGLTQFGYFIGGESLWSLLYNFAVPNWYLEGDAVQTETLLSDAGRGRTPYFFKEQKAMLFNNRFYSYMKARDGSFKSLMPNHYPLGYAMLQEVRNNYGPDVWKRVMARGAGYHGLFYSFSRGLKHETGLTTRKMYYKTYGALKERWENDLKQVTLIPTTQVSRLPKHTVTHYQWPHLLKDGSILCTKTSFKEIGYLVELKDGKEKNLTVLGVLSESYLSLNNNRAAWSEMATDARWQNRNYNNIVSYDLNTGKRKRITCKGKLFAPEFSGTGDRIVAIKADEAIQNHIVMIDPASGKELEALPNPENDFLAYPHWTGDDKAIVYLAKRNSQIAILKYDLATKQVSELSPWSHHVIAALQVAKEHVYFSASYSGINNIYRVPMDGSKTVEPISSVKISAEMPAVSEDERQLWMAEFDVMGFKITRQPIQPGPALTITEPASMAVFRIQTTKNENSILPRIPSKNYEEKAYKGFARGARLHTWGLNSQLSGIGLNLKIDNILNDFSADVTVGYNRNEKALGLAGTLSYAHYYLPIYVGATVNNRTQQIYDNPAATNGDSVTLRDVHFQEAIYQAGLNLPLSWISGPYRGHFKLGGGLQQIMTNNYKLDDKTFNSASYNFTGVAASLTFYNLRQTALQQVLPRFGQRLTASINQSISSSDALRYMASGTLYLPGISRNHSLSFVGSWKQENRSNNYHYQDNFNHARGYKPILGDEEYVISANYQLPLLYPDFGFWGLAYLKRIRLNAFGDYSQVKRKDINTTFDQSSVGGEAYFDVVIAHVIPLSFGYRYSALLNKDFYNSNKKNFSEVFVAGTF